MHNIVGRCAVLEHQEYISSKLYTAVCLQNFIQIYVWLYFKLDLHFEGRPTEIPEQHVYICESVYDESIRQVVKFEPEGLKKYSHSNAVHEDEIYFFRRLINPPKVRHVTSFSL